MTYECTDKNNDTSYRRYRLYWDVCRRDGDLLMDFDTGYRTIYPTDLWHIFVGFLLTGLLYWLITTILGKNLDWRFVYLKEL